MKRKQATVVVLLGTLVFICVLLGYGLKENKLSFTSENLEFKGLYKEIVNIKEVQSVELVNELPKIILRTNGFSVGAVRKGYFKTENNEIVKLILNSDNKPYILVTKSNGEKIYYSARKESNEVILNKMKKEVPNLFYK